MTTVPQGARVVFFVLIITQCHYLAAYPAEYNWYAVTVSFAPAVIVWCFLIAASAKLRWFIHVWVLYILALIFNIGIVFGVVVDSIDKDRFLGPNNLKVALCITPLLLLLLLRTGNDWRETDERRELVSKLFYWQMAIDLLDVLDMIDIVLEENEYDIGIPKRFGMAMIAMAHYTLLLSPLQMAVNIVGGEVNATEILFQTTIIRNILEIASVNLPFLIFRAVVFFKYGKKASIFIAKNVIAIILSIRQL